VEESRVSRRLSLAEKWTPKHQMKSCWTRLFSWPGGAAYQIPSRKRDRPVTGMLFGHTLGGGGGLQIRVGGMNTGVRQAARVHWRFVPPGTAGWDIE